MIKVQNRKIFYVVKSCFLFMYKKSARFQLENWDAQARLGSAWLGSAQEILAWTHHKTKYILSNQGLLAKEA